MTKLPLHHLSAVELNKAFVQGDATAVQIAEYFLKRIENHNQQLGAFLSILGPRMILKAEKLDLKRSQISRLANWPASPSPSKTTCT